MTDYKKIRVSPGYSRLRSIDTAVIHQGSRNWLQSQLEKESDNTVVITHHAPSSRSLPESRRDDLTSAAYASHLDEVVEQSNAKLWIHGHLHNSSDYRIGKTRVLCNPRGYPDERNDRFAPGLVVSV